MTGWRRKFLAGVLALGLTHCGGTEPEPEVTGEGALAVTVKSSNGRALSVSQKYGFTPSISAETSCEQAAQALMPAVQDLIKQLVSHAEFGALTQAPEGAAPAAAR